VLKTHARTHACKQKISSIKELKIKVALTDLLKISVEQLIEKHFVNERMVETSVRKPMEETSVRKLMKETSGERK
jgi:hypothetical protein